MSAPGNVLIEARNVARIIEGEVPTTLIADVDLSVHAGEFIAITGPSGSGKSSLLYLLGLLDLPTRGEVLVHDRATSRLNEDERADLRLGTLGFVFQFHFLLPEFTALENVLLPMRALRRLSDATMRERGLALLDSLGLADHAMKRPEQMSGGQRQRVAIARALANDASVILADEPTGNLDTKSSEQMLSILHKLAGEPNLDGRGRAVMIVTHDLGLAARTDRRVHIVDGRIAPAGDEPARGV